MDCLRDTMRHANARAQKRFLACYEEVGMGSSTGGNRDLRGHSRPIVCCPPTSSMKFRPTLRSRSATSNGSRCITRLGQFRRPASAHPGDSR